MNAAQIVMPALGPALPELILSVGVLVLILYGAFKGERSTEGVSVGALILLILLIALQVKLWTGQGGIREVWRLEHRVSEQKAENARLKTRNETLQAEVDDLKHGDEAVEERARSELGLLKPGEAFYQVVEPTNAAPKPNDDGGH